LLERFKENIQVKHSDKDIKKKNKRRHEAIKEHFEEQTIISKPKFLEYLERSDKPNEEIQGMKESAKDVDFAKANPNNQRFMNELALAGGSITEGFLEVFNIEVNKSVERYKEQLQIIEEYDLENDNSYFFIGGFQDDKLKQYSVKKKSKQDLEPYIEKHNERELQKNKLKDLSDVRQLEKSIEDNN